MSKADVMAGRAFVSIGMKSSITKDLNKLKTELNDFGSSIMSIGAKVSGMGLAITGSLTAAVMHFANVGSELNDMSARTGIGTTALAELGYAAKMTGTSMESVERAIGKMQKNIAGVGEESATVTAALSAIGLSSSRLAGLAPEDQFQLISESIAAIEDPAQRSAAAMGVFGKSGRELLPMMQNIKALRAEARELGIAPSPESIAAADAIGDAIDRVRAVVSSTVFEIGAALAPMAADILDGFLVVTKAVKKFVVENKSLIVTAAKVGTVLMVAGSAIVAIGATFIGAGMAISGVLSVMSLFGGAIGVITSLLAVVLSPVGILVAALVAGAYAWARFSESGRAAVSGLVGIITGTFGGILTTVKDTMGGIMDAIMAGDLSLAGQIAMVGLKLVFVQALDGIYKLFGATIGAIVSQLLTGDFAGAWKTLGATIINSMATAMQGTVEVVAMATNQISAMYEKLINKIVDGWRRASNAATDYILESASDHGILTGPLELVSGVDMTKETARGKQLDEERKKKGLTPKEREQAKADALWKELDPLTDNGKTISTDPAEIKRVDALRSAWYEQEQKAKAMADTQSDPALTSSDIGSVDAIAAGVDASVADQKAKIDAIVNAAKENMNQAVVATDQAAADATAGKPQAASAEVQALQAELAALKKQASEKVTAMNASTSGGGSEGTGGAGGIGTKGSVASFSLAQLAGSVGRGTAEKQLTVAQQQKKLQEQALIVGQQTMLAMMGLGMNFPP